MEQKISSRIYQSNDTSSESYFIKGSFEGYSYYIAYFFIFFLVIFILVASLIKYPDTQEGNLQLINGTSNYKLTPSFPGRIVFAINESTRKVDANQILGYIDNSANLNEIEQLTELLESTKADTFFLNVDFPILKIGELSSKYFLLINAVRDYKNILIEIKKNYVGLSLQKKIENANKILDYNNRSLEELRFRESFFESMNNRDSSLLEKNIISQSDFERDLISRLTISQDRFVLEKLSYNILDAIDNAHISLKNYVFTNEIKLLELRSRIIDATMNLKNSIREWRSKYLIVSPCDGKVEINNMIMSGSFVSFQDVIFTVKPNNSKWQANLYVDQNNSAKIKNGQKVIVKLSMFPSSEFGHIVGKVKYISEIPIYQNYNNQSKALILVKVELPDVLLSSSKLKLEPINELSGVGEIITEEKRLIERILNF